MYNEITTQIAQDLLDAGITHTTLDADNLCSYEIGTITVEDIRNELWTLEYRRAVKALAALVAKDFRDQEYTGADTSMIEEVGVVHDLAVEVDSQLK